MTLKFYLDTHIDKQVAIQLIQDGIIVVRCQDVGLADASDEEHLEYAIKNQFTIITKDDDFYKLHFYLVENGISHWEFFCVEIDKHLQLARLSPFVEDIII